MSEFDEVGDGRPPERQTTPDNVVSDCESGRGPCFGRPPDSKTDETFGRGTVDERGSIDFGSPLGSPAPDRLGAPAGDRRAAGDRLAAPGDRVGAPGDGPLDMAKFKLELYQAAMQMMMDVFSKSLFGFGKDQGGGANPFMQMIQKIMQKALGDVIPGGVPGPGPGPGPRRDAPPPRRDAPPPRRDAPRRP